MAVTSSPSFEVLQERIKQALSKAIKQNQIRPKNLLFILEILGQADSLEKLHFWLEIFADDFTVLGDLIHQDKKIMRSDFENKVKDYVAKLLQTDPLKAAEVSRQALQKDMTEDKLKILYPEFAQYLKNP